VSRVCALGAVPVCQPSQAHQLARPPARPPAQVAAEECNANLEDATEKQLKTLADWEAKFREKYAVVGRLVS